MPTISDVAKRAGVSPATVSRVIQGAPNVRPATRAKVEQAIEELGYVPSAVAQSLRSKRTRSLALVVPDITNTFWTTVARGVEDVAQEHDYSVFLGNTDEDPAKQLRYLDFLVSQQVDGVVIAPYASDAAHLHRLRSRNIPTVIIDRKIDGWEVDSVYADSLSGARAAVQHLISLGHTRIGMVSGPVITSTAEDRVTGYCMALSEARIPIDPDLIQRGEYRIVSGRDLAHRLLETGLEPTAIFAANNALAMGVVDALAEYGLRIPQDIALVCFDDLPNASHLFPFLTVVAQPVYEMGMHAAQLLLSRLESKVTLQPRHVVLPTRLVIRHSCGSKLTTDRRCPLSLPLPGSEPEKSILVSKVTSDQRRGFARDVTAGGTPAPGRERHLADYDKSDAARLVKALHHQEPDRLPHLELNVTSRAVFEYVLGRALDNDAPDGHPRTLKISPEDHIEFAQRLGLDAVPCSLGTPPVQPVSSLARVATNLGPLGSVVQQLTYLERYVRAAQGTRVGIVGSLGSFFAPALRVTGAEDLAATFRDDRAYAEERMDTLLEQQETLMRIVCDRFAADLVAIVINDDLADHNGLLLPRALFDEVFVPRMQKLIAPAREHGLPVLLHSPGKVDELLPILYKLGVSGILPLQPEHHDIFKIKNQWANKLVFVGSFPTDLLVHGTKNEIESVVREFCTRLAPGGGYVLSSSAGIAHDTPPENLVMLARAVHKFGRYGALGNEI